LVVGKTILVGLVIVNGRLSWWCLKFHLIEIRLKTFTYLIYTIKIHIFTQEHLDILFIINNHIWKISRVDISSLKVDATNSFDFHLDHLTLHTRAPNYLAYFERRLSSRQTLVAANINNKFEDFLRILHWTTCRVINTILLNILLIERDSLTVLRILASIVALIWILWITRHLGSHTHLQLILRLDDIFWILWHRLLHLTWHFRLHLSFGKYEILIRLKLLLSSLLHRIPSVLLW
jgi:hypothetical protein